VLVGGALRTLVPPRKHPPLAAMKPMRILCVSLGVLWATSRASAQGIVSQLGGFLERVQDVPQQQAGPLAFLNPAGAPTELIQQEQPLFPVASPQSIPPAMAASVAAVAPVMPAFAPAPAPASFVMSNDMTKPKGLLTLRSMRVSNPGAEGSKIFFGTGSEFSMGTDSAGNFMVQQASMASPFLSLDSQDTLHLASSRVEANALNAVNGISVRGVKQWQLVYSDDFSAAVAGWGQAEVTQCGGVFMLGGFCKKIIGGELNKTFTGLPPHKQLRVRATYHFIDRWIGETGYMKLDVGMQGCSEPVWTEQHLQQDATHGLSVCGNAAVPEGKFAAPIEVTVPHRKDSITLTFGSTIGGNDPCDESWGVSAVEIYVRN